MKNARCLFTLSLGCLLAAAPAASPAQGMGQMSGMAQTDKKPLPSPPADAMVTLEGKAVSIHYNAPSMRGRAIMGGLVPYGKVWRTGANPATLFKTATDLKIGGTMVPAGTYTLYTLPSEGTWKLIVNKQTGQWGTEYNEPQDLARIDMKKSTLSTPQELMSISFEKTHGKSTELHVRWEKTDVWVPVVAQ
ncbi:DUF2911 domain-containing protein [Acidipila sp. EB88]|uniref:DUF2911 domain-containing protein n=1 Tax=Acidipila sp. EB88 TaxID=2305226 RepID=UPI000F5E0E71|nr:DUF2911 domain-containing protein [Acidipila sp. EB88]RRA47489.1 DUF2911 domain-containing protein [Acidipila sp. EB88]